MKQIAEKEKRIGLRKNTILNKKYKILKVIAISGFSITYLAYDITEKTYKVVKECFPCRGSYRNIGGKYIFWENEYDKNEQIYLFDNEANVLKVLEDISNIPKFYDFFMENSTVYLVMEFFEGRTLLDIVEHKKRIEADECLEYMIQVAISLDKMHQRKVVHRDICPENIIISSDKAAKIIDFGSSIELGINDKVIAESTYRRGYSPLEQYSKHGAIGAWTDVYAFCATIYYCILGKLPPAAIERNFCDSLEIHQILDIGLDEKLVKILKKGFEIRPENRWQSVKELFPEILEI